MMFCVFFFLIVVVVFVVGLVYVQQLIQKVEVFVNLVMVLINVQGVIVYCLDGFQQLQDELFQGLFSDFNKVVQFVQQCMCVMGVGLQEWVSNVVIGIGLVMQYGVDCMLVVVINGQVIVYGVIDVVEVVCFFFKLVQVQGNGRCL